MWPGLPESDDTDAGIGDQVAECRRDAVDQPSHGVGIRWVPQGAVEQNDRRPPDVGPSDRPVRTRIGIAHDRHPLQPLEVARSASSWLQTTVRGDLRRRRAVQPVPTTSLDLRKSPAGQAPPPGAGGRPTPVARVRIGPTIGGVDREATPDLVVLEIVEVEHRWCQVGPTGKEPGSHVDSTTPGRRRLW